MLLVRTYSQIIVLTEFAVHCDRYGRRWVHKSSAGFPDRAASRLWAYASSRGCSNAFGCVLLASFNVFSSAMARRWATVLSRTNAQRCVRPLLFLHHYRRGSCGEGQTNDESLALSTGENIMLSTVMQEI